MRRPPAPAIGPPPPQPQIAIPMAVYAVFGCVDTLFGKLLEYQRGAERGHADALLSHSRRDESGDAVGSAGVYGASRMDAEMRGDVRLDMSDYFAGGEHLRQQMGIRQSHYPIGPVQLPDVIAGL